MMGFFWAGLESLFFKRTIGVVGFLILVILIFATGSQLAPGREWVQLGWPDIYYYLAIGSVGAVVGLIGGQRPWLAAICGAIAAVGALWLIGVTERMHPGGNPKAWGAVAVLAVGLGLLPAVALYSVGDAILSRRRRS